MEPNNSKVIVEDPLNVFRFENEWHSSAFDFCEDYKLTFCSFFCWLFSVCTLIRELKESCFSFICIPCPLILYRTKMRSNLRIKGSIWRDSLMSIFLPFCTVLQMKLELKHRGLIDV